MVLRFSSRKYSCQSSGFRRLSQAGCPPGHPDPTHQPDLLLVLPQIDLAQIAFFHQSDEVSNTSQVKYVPRFGRAANRFSHRFSYAFYLNEFDASILVLWQH